MCRTSKDEPVRLWGVASGKCEIVPSNVGGTNRGSNVGDAPGPRPWGPGFQDPKPSIAIFYRAALKQAVLKGKTTDDIKLRGPDTNKKEMKDNPIIKLVNYHIIDYPTPVNLSY